MFLNNIFLLAVSVLACTPLCPAIGKFFARRREEKSGTASCAAVGVYDALTAIVPVGLVGLSLLALVGNSYNPFLYFRF